MLATGMSLTLIAERLECSRSVVRLWASSETIRKEVGAITTEVRTQAATRFRALADVAIDVLEEVALDDKQPGSARVKAAEAILSRAGFAATSVVELVDEGALRGPSSVQAERVILTSAAEILREHGYPDLAGQLDDAIAAGPVEEG